MNEIEFSLSPVMLSNIASLKERGARISELRICELSELANEIADMTLSMLDSGFGLYEALSQVASELAVNETRTLHEGTLDENKRALSALASATSALDAATLARLLAEEMRERGKTLTESDFFTEGSPPEIMAFVKNPLSLEAYDVFSQDMVNPRLSYTKDMKETAARLKSGEVGYCILPLEERGGVRLKAVTELIFEEDLKINSVTPVFGEYGGADMKYALVSENISVPNINDGDDRYLEIRVKGFTSAMLTELMLAAITLGAELYRINTISYGSEGKDIYYTVVFKCERGDFTELLTYLTLYTSDYTAVGIYKNLE